MTRDEILDEYETLWRQAALEDRPRMGEKPGADCAAVVYGAYDRLSRPALDSHRAWTCHEDGRTAMSLAGVIIHMFDNHRWTWDMFANKFRDALAEGERLALKRDSA